MTDQLDTYPHDLAGEDAPPPVQPSPRQLVQGRRLRDQQRAAGRHAAPGQQLREATGDLVAPAVLQLISEANAANPGRDKASDGTWGDARHQALGSATDHNAWLRYNGHGYVRAGDIDVDGLDLPTAFERGRQLAAAGQLSQVLDGGYFILNERITRPDFSGWAAYTGTDPHVTHGHASVSRTPAGFLSVARWGLFDAAPAPAPAPPAAGPAGAGWTGPDAVGRGVTYRATFQPGPQSNGQRVADLQAFLKRYAPAYAGGLVVDGWFGQQTAGVVAEFARRSNIAGADGLNVGPKIATALFRAGFDR